MIEENVEVAVIGGGAAGLAAAIRAKETGAEKVIILDRNSELGGILPQCIHTGFGLHHFRENLTGPEYIARFVEKARSLKVKCKLDTMVLKVTPEKEVVAVNSPDGLMTLKSRAIVLAMGCRERPRGALEIPGTRPAGIFTAGTAQRLMDIEGYLPGKRIVILGSGDVGLIVARRFAMEGARVEAVVEIMPYSGGLSRNLVQCLEDFQIPMMLEHTITFIHGTKRVEAVTIAKVDERGNPISGTEMMILCDTLILSVGLIPENELSEAMGIVLDPAAGGPVVSERMETSIPGIFACGNVVHVHDLVDYVSEMGELAGEGAANYALGRLPPLTRKIVLKAGQNVRYVVPQIISGEKPVTIFMRVRTPMRNVKVKIGKLTMPIRVVRPPETVVFLLTERRLENLGKEAELTVNIEEEIQNGRGGKA